MKLEGIEESIRAIIKARNKLNPSLEISVKFMDWPGINDGQWPVFKKRWEGEADTIYHTIVHDWGGKTELNADNKLTPGDYCRFLRQKLIFGWDGTGWQRFTYDATIMGVPWTPGATMGLDWLTSNVAITLYILGIVFLPPYLYITTKWATEGMRADPEVKAKLPEKNLMVQLRVGAYALLGVGLTLGLAFASAGLGWAFIAAWGEPISAGLLGIAIVAVVSYFLLFREGMLFRWFLDKFTNP